MKKYLSVLLATALVMAATTAFAAGEKTSLTLANTQPDTDIESQQLYACEEALEAATDGNFNVEVFTNSALGDTDDILEQAIQGTPILTVTDPGRLADYIPGIRHFADAVYHGGLYPDRPDYGHEDGFRLGKAV